MTTRLHSRTSGSSDAPAALKAICFDLDGTLYAQEPLRRKMAVELVRASFLKPHRAPRTIRILREYRIAQEALRGEGSIFADIADAQLRRCAERSGYPMDVVQACIANWFEEAPLRFLRSCVREGVTDFLARAKQRGLLLAVFSDYPAEAKLQAMGLRAWFDLVASAQDPEVQAFKPHPAGLQFILRKLGVEPAEMLYIGDRASVDGSAAERAGVRAAIVGQSRTEAGQHWIAAASFGDLQMACAL